MFFKKRKPKEEVKICNHKVCYKCGHLFETGGKVIKVIREGFVPLERIFCLSCVPNYDYVVLGGKEYYGFCDSYFIPDFTEKYFKHQPDIEVNKKSL